MPRGTSRHPFAIEEPASRSKIWAIAAALACAMILAIAAGPQLGRSWLAGYLGKDLAGLGETELSSQMQTMVELGEPGISLLVRQMIHGESRVAAAAFRTLSDAQGAWATRWPTRSDALQFHLIACIEQESVANASDRTNWICQLSQQVLLDTLQSSTSPGRNAYATAVRLLAKNPVPQEVASTERTLLKDAVQPQASSTNQQSLVPKGVQEIADGPALADSQAVDPSLGAKLENLPAGPNESSQESPPQSLVPPTATVLLPPAPSALTSTGNNAVLQFTAPRQDASQQPTTPPEHKSEPKGTSLSPTSLSPVAQSLTPYETREVIELLVGASAELMQAAENELTRRGFNLADIKMARTLVAATAAERLKLVEQLSEQDTVDPRPFLLWLSQDADRHVRVAAINILGTMSDPLIRRKLREQLNIESDPLVAGRLREAIGLKR